MTGFEAMVQLVAERALNSLPAGLLLAALAWCLLRFVGKQSSGTRFGIWFATLVAVVALPFVPPMIPAADRAQAFGQSLPIALPAIWAHVMFAGWLLIVSVALVHIAVGLWSVLTLRRSCTPVATSALPTEIQGVIQEFQVTRPATVCSSSRVRVPSAMGFFRPLIVLPEWALTELSQDELRTILLHEFGHIKRLDDWTNLAQKLLRAIFFFNPAVWFIEKRLSSEREMACDELVLARTGNRRSYAECLVSLAEKSAVVRNMSLVQAVIGRATETALRLAHILDTNQPLTTRIFKPVLTAGIMLTAFSLLAAPGAPKLVGFQDSNPQSRESSSAASASTPDTAKVVTARLLQPAKTDGGQAHVGRQVLKNTGAGLGDRPSTRSNQVIAAKRKHSERPSDLVVPVRANELAPQPQLLLIMQTTEYDGTGLARQSLCVWRVTFSRGVVTTTEVVEKSL